MVFVYFIICAAIVVMFSVRLSNTADWFEKNTKISGAVVGFLLAATTSIPELVSGYTAILINQEEIAISSILGSNLFNYNIVATANLAFIVFLAFNKTSKNTRTIVLFIVSIYALFLTTNFIDINIKIPKIFPTFSYISPLILLIYFISFKAISEEEEPTQDIAPKVLVRKTLIKFIFYAVILVIFSCLLAIIVEDIVQITNIKASLAGSILLGASTSLPEFVGALALMRLRQYNIAISSVLSSNLFNFFVFAFLDIISVHSLTKFFVVEINNLIVFGFLISLFIYIILRFFSTSKKYLYAIPSIIILASYFIYLIKFS